MSLQSLSFGATKAVLFFTFLLIFEVEKKEEKRPSTSLIDSVSFSRGALLVYHVLGR